MTTTRVKRSKSAWKDYWHTPKYILDLAAEILGDAIVLDPATAAPRPVSRESIRSRRRNRWRKAAHLRELDKQARDRIDKNMLWSMETWGGTRCPDCGTTVRPHWLANLSGPMANGWITAFGPACNYVRKCPGRRDWM